MSRLSDVEGAFFARLGSGRGTGSARISAAVLLPRFRGSGLGSTHWLLETKGQESAEVSFKDRAATQWCENATSLTELEHLGGIARCRRRNSRRFGPAVC